MHYTATEASKTYDRLGFGVELHARHDREALIAYLTHGRQAGCDLLQLGCLLRIARAVETLVERSNGLDEQLYWHREYLLHIKSQADELNDMIQREWKRIAKFADVQVLKRRTHIDGFYWLITSNHVWGSCTSEESFGARRDRLPGMKDALKTLKKVRKPEHLTLLPGVGKVTAKKVQITGPQTQVTWPTGGQEF